MFARVSCPACKYQFSIPEGSMAKRHVCPNCQSPFIAGKSAAEAAAATAPQAAAQPAYAKTMLGEVEPPIKYNCPRCQAALEAPVSEAATKKPCPACGQRVQVPNPPPNRALAATPARGLDKTMLATDERATPPQPPIKYNCPNCKKPLEAPASEGGVKKNCPACGQRLQVPAAPALAGSNLNKTMLASEGGTLPSSAGAAAYATPAAAAPGSPVSPPPAMPARPTLLTPRNIGIAAGVVFILAFILPAVFRGGKAEDTVALARAKEEFEKFKAEVQRKEKELERETAHEREVRHNLESLVGKYRDLEQRLREEQRQTLREITDLKQRAALEEKFEAAQRRFEREKAEMEKSQQKLLEEAKVRLDESKRALDASRQDQVRTQTIIQQPPVMYYPPYDWRYWRPWW